MAKKETGEKLVKSKQRKKDFGEVYTPAWLVKDMCNLIPKWEIATRVLEPSCGSGNFLVEILERKLALCHTGDDVIAALKSIYGIDLLPDNVLQAKERLWNMLIASGIPFDVEVATIVLNCNIQQGDALTMKKASGAPLTFVDWDKDTEEEEDKEVCDDDGNYTLPFV